MKIKMFFNNKENSIQQCQRQFGSSAIYIVNAGITICFIIYAFNVFFYALLIFNLLFINSRQIKVCMMVSHI